MNVLIAEDESIAADHLEVLLKQCEPTIQVIEKIDAVRDLIAFLSLPKPVDLLLLDVQLADGKIFEAFSNRTIEIPIVFTTAFDQYALQAFKFHSIDYLLKPIQKSDLQAALDKFKKYATHRLPEPHELQKLRSLLFPEHKPFKERFIVKTGNRLQYKNVNEIAYFYAEGKEVFIVTKKDGRKLLIDNTLEELDQRLDPQNFFRISRKFIISVDSILEVRGLISNKLEIKLSIHTEHEFYISRERAQDFKSWLDR
jgi:two-component system response regulator LytT